MRPVQSDKDDQPPDEPADKLYNQGVFLLNEEKNYKEAAKKFEEVDRQHPYSEWARKALIMSAYAYYEARDYDDSVTAARRYISLHPGSPEAAYAQYPDRFVLLRPDPRRDPRSGPHRARDRRARRSGAQISQHRVCATAKRKIEIGRDQLAAKEMDIGRANQQKKNFIGAINRFKVVVTQYQTTRHVEEALLRLTECYMALGIVEEAQTAAAVLGHNFPDSPWYQDAYNLVKGGGVRAEARRKALDDPGVQEHRSGLIRTAEPDRFLRETPNSGSRTSRDLEDIADLQRKCAAGAPNLLFGQRGGNLMLTRLSIRDIVLIDRLDIDFSSGLSVLTGETGAGKSILLDAFALALGGRGDAGLVRKGAEQGQVIAAFDVAAAPPGARAAGGQ